MAHNLRSVVQCMLEARLLEYNMSIDMDFVSRRLIASIHLLSLQNTQLGCIS